jgi:hypothetical protein
MLNEEEEDKVDKDDCKSQKTRKIVATSGG